MADIKIFVSHRTDMDSVTIDNPLYVNVRCGAVYDKRENVTMLGDNTGDNISTKKPYYSELTVQYWAWKNVEADYYGLCHYRRYLSLSSQHFLTDERGHVLCPFLDERAMQRFGLLNSYAMEAFIEKYDCIIPYGLDVRYIDTPCGPQSTVYDHWAAHRDIFLDKVILDLLISTIQKYCPEWYDDTIEYLHGYIHYAHDCFILTKKLFDELCLFQFSVLFSMESEVDSDSFDGDKIRALGYCGEILNGVFIYHLTKAGTFRIKEVQMVYVENTVVPSNLLQHALLTVNCAVIPGLRVVLGRFLPAGTSRRKIIRRIYKNIYHKIF